MNSFLTNLSANGRRTDILERIETPAAALTLTRSATLAITTAGTTITWQTETRNRGFTWSGTQITIPTSGYYSISFTYSADKNATAFVFVYVNTIEVLSAVTSTNGTSALSAGTMRYFNTGDVITIRIQPTVNFVLQLVTEGAVDESPILHIVQLTGVI